MTGTFSSSGNPGLGFRRPVRLLVLGLGNVLCGDDGLGAAAIARLIARYEIPEGMSVLDGGTLGLSLLPYVEDAEKVILVDSIRAEEPPGSFVRLEGEEVGPAVAGRLSVHQVGVADLLDAARWRGRFPEELVLLGLVPETLEVGLTLSARVEAGLPGLVDGVVKEVNRLGFELHPRSLQGKGRLLEPKSPSGPDARLRAGLRKKPEGVTLVSARRSPRQFLLHPYMR